MAETDGLGGFLPYKKTGLTGPVSIYKLLP
jgi:hypothetical protein